MDGGRWRSKPGALLVEFFPEPVLRKRMCVEVGVTRDVDERWVQHRTHGDRDLHRLRQRPTQPTVAT